MKLKKLLRLLIDNNVNLKSEVKFCDAKNTLHEIANIKQSPITGIVWLYETLGGHDEKC